MYAIRELMTRHRWAESSLNHVNNHGGGFPLSSVINRWIFNLENIGLGLTKSGKDLPMTRWPCINDSPAFKIDMWRETARFSDAQWPYNHTRSRDWWWINNSVWYLFCITHIYASTQAYTQTADWEKQKEDHVYACALTSHMIGCQLAWYSLHHFSKWQDVYLTDLLYQWYLSASLLEKEIRTNKF